MAFLMRNSLQIVLPRCHWLRSGLVNSQYFSASAIYLQKQNPVQSDGDTSSGAKKHKESIKITLIQNQNMTVTALEEAKNLAKRRSMHLVQVQKMDAKTQRPVYKLVTAAERLQEELSDLKSSSNGTASTTTEKSSQKKSEKTLNIGSRISEHDLSSRLKNISKWLDKNHEVRILIQGSDKDLASGEKIFKTIEEFIKTPKVIGKIVQKRSKGAIIKFNVLPVTEESVGKPSSVPKQ